MDNIYCFDLLRNFLEVCQRVKKAFDTLFCPEIGTNTKSACNMEEKVLKF